MVNLLTYPLYNLLCWCLFGAALCVFLTLFFIRAPYGRHSRAGWGPTLPARPAWILMEAVSPAAFLIGYLSSVPTLSGMLLAALWLGHYGYRSLIYPLRLRGRPRPMPLVTFAMAAAFNALNGLVNGWGIAHAWHLDAGYISHPLFIAGLVLFGLGFALNVHSDGVLRRLRGPNDSGYHVPRKGLHRFVAAPNYLGECLEWLGFAIAAGTTAAYAFAFFTAANLVPRARAHLNWYRAHFPDYPRSRKALIPGLW